MHQALHQPEATTPPPDQPLVIKLLSDEDKDKDNHKDKDKDNHKDKDKDSKKAQSK